MSKNHYFVLVYGGKCMGGSTDKAKLERMAEFFGEGSEVVQVEGTMPADLTEVASRFYAARDQELADEVDALLDMTEEERQEMLDVIENPDVRAMFERPVDLDCPLGEWGEDCDSTHVTSRSGLFKSLRALSS